MRPSFPPKLSKHRASGAILVHLHTPWGVRKLSTGQTSFARAREVCTQAMVEELQMAACANLLTADAISRLTTGRRFTCADILEAWEAETQVDLAPDTFAAYRTTLHAWLAECDCAREPLAAIKRCRLHRFVNAEGLSLGSRKGRLVALRSFYGFASAHGYCVGNLAEAVRVNATDLLFAGIERHPTQPITPEEFERLIASPKLTGFWRWATFLGYWAGYRLRDVACLEWASLRGQELVIYPQKTRHNTIARVALPIDHPLVGGGVLRRIFLEVMEQSPSDSPFCFPVQRARILAPEKRAVLSYSYVRILNRHQIRGKRFHSLRHACARRWEAAGHAPQDIAPKLGHASAATTEIYLGKAPL